MTKMTTVRISDSTYNKLKNIAITKRMSINQFIASSIEQFIEDESKIIEEEEKPFTREDIARVIKELIKTNNWDKNTFLLDKRFSSTQIELIRRNCLPHVVTKDIIEEIVSRLGIQLWK